MLRLGGSPEEVGRTWGEINRQVIVREVQEHYVKRAAAAGISRDALLERSRAFVRIVQQIAPHWLEEARAVAQAAGIDEDLYIAFLGGRPRDLFLHECTSYAVSREHAHQGAIFFHKTRDNVDKEQAAYILESSLPGVHKFIGVCDASGISCSMMVNDQGLAGAADYPAHLTRQGDPSALLPEAAEPQYRGMMGGSILRHVAERASNCREALTIVEDFVRKGYYAGGHVNGNHWLFVDREGVILEVSNNTRHVASRFHRQKVYFSRLDSSAAAKRLREAQGPIDFALFHGVSRDPSICLKSSISGMSVEIDPDRPSLLTCAWISLPARAGSFPLMMGQTKTPRCLLNGQAYLLGKVAKAEPQTWENLERAAHADKERLKGRVLAAGASGGETAAAEALERWSQGQAEALVERLQAPESPAAELIRRAGNADSDAQRLALLRQLRALPGLDRGLAADADKLIAFVDTWVQGTDLHFYSREVSRKQDVDIGIAASSPLYPLTYLYRGRAVLTLVLQSGNLWSYADRRREWFDKARGFFEQAHRAFPENRIARMYLGEGLPWTRDWEPVPAAPAWAAQQRLGLEGVADIIQWWLDNRQQPNGAFGGGWGDDCEMWRWWVPVLVGFDDAAIRRGQTRFSEALLSQPHMAGGYMSGMTDVEHSAEDSTDAILPMMHLEPDNPAWQRRALRLAELMEKVWTGRNQRGHLQFKSTYFNVHRVLDEPQKACDTPYHVRAVLPLFLYWLRSGDARVGRLLSDWMSTWVDAAARSENGKPAGVLPAALHWPEGSIGGLSPAWWDPQNHSEPTLYQWPSAMGGLTDALLLTYHMTRDEKYLEPIRAMARLALRFADTPAASAAVPGSEAWCANRMGFLRGTLAKYRLLTSDASFDRLLRGGASPVLSLQLTGDRSPLVAALESAALAFSYNFERYTSEVRYTDRVLRFPAVFQGEVRLAEPKFPVRSPDPELLYSSVTGDPGGAGTFPMAAVRWLTPPREIAALVTNTRRNRREAELFHFGRASRAMGAELYLLEPGQYQWTLAAGNKTLQQAAVAVSGPRTQVAFTLPARQACRLTIAPR